MRLQHAAAWILLLYGSLLQSQENQARLRVKLESAPGTPVAGALVALVDAGGRIAVEGLSAEDGATFLRAPAGTYRVRVRRIGFEPFFSSPRAVTDGADIALQIESKRVVLRTVVVTARSRCGRLDGDTQLGFAWEEISKALRASQLTVRDLSGFARARVHRKVTMGQVLESNESRIVPVSDRRPFRAANPARLAADGYVSGNEREGWRYFGPDETVLLSPEFAATHCFRLVSEPSRPGHLGMAFAPLPRRRIPDIAGVVWVDQTTSELREIVFRYVNAGLLDRFHAGGYTRFRRVPSGAWMVDQWSLRAPRLGARPDRPGEVVEIGHVEDGGQVIPDSSSR